jgi:hypothetical protein
MNTNDLPPAAKLAALIEAGRAANPDLAHGRGHFYSSSEGSACALGFAALGAGVARIKIDFDGAGESADTVEGALGLPIRLFSSDALTGRVARMNDEGETIDEILFSLREGELAKVSA